MILISMEMENRLVINAFSKLCSLPDNTFSNPHPSATWVHLQITCILYQRYGGKSSLFLCCRFSFCKIQNSSHSLKHSAIVFRNVGKLTPAAVFDPRLRVAEVTSAPAAQSIKRTIAEQTVEIVLVFNHMTGEIFALSVLKIRMVIFSHRNASITIHGSKRGR